jgi:SAM-dependent methyltransferase
MRAADLFAWGKWLLFPGLDLNTRLRYRLLPKLFRTGPLDTLDAGCGNGALSYAAYRRGNRVLGVTLDAQQVARNIERFRLRHVDSTRLQFETLNLYDLPKLGRTFDQIICSETLEHIRGDRQIVGHFYQLLRPGGVLHLCCPFALHPRNHLGRTDNPEDGGHVRDGYTYDSYRALLEPVGFRLGRRLGLSSPFYLRLDWPIRQLRVRAGDAVALPLFLATLPLQLLERPDPAISLSIYVEALKPS